MEKEKVIEKELVAKTKTSLNKSETEAIRISKDTSNIQNLWNMPASSLQASIDASQIYKTKHGMFAGVPILCKNKLCPYVKVCIIPEGFRIVDGRCAMEAGAVMARFDSWCKHFSIDLTGQFINDEDLVDASLIRDLVDNEIQTLRAENRIAINADFIGDIISQVDIKGNVYYEEAVTPAAEYKLLLQDKRYKILNLLNSTRKDKAKIISNENSPSQQAATIFKKIASMLPDDLDSIDFDVVPETDYEIIAENDEVK